MIGLTAEQFLDVPTKALAEILAQRLAKLGRTAQIRGITPDELIVGLQTYTAAQRHPQWQTIPADLVLMGDLKSNVLMYDQILATSPRPRCIACKQAKPWCA